MPQLKNGYVRIASELLDALCKIRIPGQQSQCLLYIIRKTYGFQKKEDLISLSQFSSATGMNKPHVVRALHGLLLKRVITKKGNGGINKYGVNKHYDEWVPLDKKGKTYQKEPTLKKYCYVCKYDKATVKHHIIHKSEGGSNRLDNIIVLCPNCHALVQQGKISDGILIAKKGNEERTVKKPLPKKVETLPKKGHTIDTSTIDTSTIDTLFEKFWNLYNHKKAINDCKDYWNGKKKLKTKKYMTDNDRELCIKNLPDYVKNTNKDGTYPTRKDPKTYLYNSSWLDETITNNKNTDSNKLTVEC